MLTLSAAVAALVALLLPHIADAPGIFLEKIKRQPPSRLEILFIGDMMFDRAIRIASNAHGDDYVLSCIADTLRNADLVVGNLEGPITTNESVSLGSVIESPENFTFTFPTSTAFLLQRHNISIVNLGNNHILNFGDDGALQTKQWLDAAGVAYFGDPLAAHERDRVVRTDVGGVPLTFINWSDWTGGSKEEVVTQIMGERAAGRIPVVYTHWGDEYVPPSDRVRALAHAFVDAGAEIVIGSHPHVVLEKEQYAGKMIYYSLGNFVFDQYWNDEVRTGLMVNAVFDRGGVVGISELYTQLERDGRTCPKQASPVAE